MGAGAAAFAGGVTKSVMVETYTVEVCWTAG